MAKQCRRHSVRHTLPVEAHEAALLRLVDGVNADPAIEGILVQLPLPEPLGPRKDVDGLNVVGFGQGDVTMFCCEWAWIRRCCTNKSAISYSCHRFLPERIARAGWLYWWVPLSLRLVEEKLLERGIIASYETICR